jgi:hypothetical protein
VSASTISTTAAAKVAMPKLQTALDPMGTHSVEHLPMHAISNNG